MMTAGRHECAQILSLRRQIALLLMKCTDKIRQSCSEILQSAAVVNQTVCKGDFLFIGQLMLSAALLLFF